MCADDKYQDVATTCVKKACKMSDSLSLFPFPLYPLNNCKLLSTAVADVWYSLCASYSDQEPDANCLRHTHA
jgi:hypothetical protein